MPSSRTLTTHSRAPRSDEISITTTSPRLEAQRVRDEVLEDAPQLPRVGLDLGQLADDELAVRLERGPEIRRDLRHHASKGNPLRPQLARAGVREHALDQLPRACRAPAQLPEHLRRGRRVGTLLEQGHEELHAREGLAEVVGNEVRVRLELALHAPLVGHLVEEGDRAAAELRDAQDERAEHVAVGERRVVGHLADPRLARLADPGVLLERLAPPHARKRLEQRVPVGCRRRQAEARKHRDVAVAEREVDDRAVVVAQGPEDPDRVGERVEQRAELRCALGADSAARFSSTPHGRSSNTASRSLTRPGYEHRPHTSAERTTARFRLTLDRWRRSRREP